MTWKMRFLIILVLFLSGCQGGVSATPTEEQPAKTPTVPATAVPATALQETQGLLTFPYRSADAGNFILQAGEEIVITWEDAPVGANLYEIFYVSSNEGEGAKLYIDTEGREKVTAAWLVPEDVSGHFEGIAHYDDGQVVRSGLSGEIYSGKRPPEGICSLSGRGTGVTNLYREPNTNNSSFAYLIPGQYAEVFEMTKNGWYLVDASLAIDPITGQEANGVGWVNGQDNVDTHGPC